MNFEHDVVRVAWFVQNVCQIADLSRLVPMLVSKRWSFGPGDNVIICGFVTFCSQRWSFGPVEQIVSCSRAWLY